MGAPAAGNPEAAGGYGGIYGGAHAMGGPVSSGMAYLVGEEGPELFVPGSSGTIVPNDQLGGDTHVNVHMTVQALDSRDVVKVLRTHAPVIAGIVRNAYNQRGVNAPG